MNSIVDAVLPEPATTTQDATATEVGSVFVSNYPPYSFWSESGISEVQTRLMTPPAGPEEVPLGLYLHIPFCRKRCKFCYFRVYTDRNSSQIQTYLDTLAREVELYSDMSRISGRPLKFVYFGGGTPSYISARHLRALADRLKKAIPWDQAEEVAFECEPGTLSKSKLETIREIGVTRLSLGLENLNDGILKENGRAHLSSKIFEVLPWVKALDFDQVNVDLISGMIGETWETWRETVRQTVEMDADSVTIYQLELPFNTVFSKHILTESGNPVQVADWALKREWHQYAIEQFEAAGYESSSAYSLVKKGGKVNFIYRDAVWQSSDMIGAGVASFSHINGIHFQNHVHWDPYIEAVEAGDFPLNRAFATTQEERMNREVILQLKTGRITTDYFSRKFGVDILESFKGAIQKLQSEKMLDFDEKGITLTRQGLLRVDQLLPEFYDEKYRNSRYT